jgi:hypothetical protein
MVLRASPCANAAKSPDIFAAWLYQDRAATDPVLRANPRLHIECYLQLMSGVRDLTMGDDCFMERFTSPWEALAGVRMGVRQ